MKIKMIGLFVLLISCCPIQAQQQIMSASEIDKFVSSQQKSIEQSNAQIKKTYENLGTISQKMKTAAEKYNSTTPDQKANNKQQTEPKTLPSCDCNDTSDSDNIDAQFVVDSAGNKVKRISPNPCICTKAATSSIAQPEESIPSSEDESSGTDWDIQY